VGLIKERKTNIKLYFYLFYLLVLKVEASYNAQQIHKSSSNKDRDKGVSEARPKGMSDEEYKQHLQERGQQWDKFLNDKKNKNVGTAAQIDLKFKEANLKRAEELAKKSDGKFELTVKMKFFKIF
jgi:hypothetical protein